MCCNTAAVTHVVPVNGQQSVFWFRMMKLKLASPISNFHHNDDEYRQLSPKYWWQHKKIQLKFRLTSRQLKLITTLQLHQCVTDTDGCEFRSAIKTKMFRHSDRLELQLELVEAVAEIKLKLTVNSWLKKHWWMKECNLANLDFDDMDGIPAAFYFVGSIPGLLHQHHAGKAVVQVPQVHRRNSALIIPATPSK